MDKETNKFNRFKQDYFKGQAEAFAELYKVIVRVVFGQEPQRADDHPFGVSLPPPERARWSRKFSPTMAWDEDGIGETLTLFVDHIARSKGSRRPYLEWLLNEESIRTWDQLEARLRTALRNRLKSIGRTRNTEVDNIMLRAEGEVLEKFPEFLLLHDNQKDRNLRIWGLSSSNRGMSPFAGYDGRLGPKVLHVLRLPIIQSAETAKKKAPLLSTGSLHTFLVALFEAAEAPLFLWQIRVMIEAALYPFLEKKEYHLEDEITRDEEGRVLRLGETLLGADDIDITELYASELKATLSKDELEALRAVRHSDSGGAVLYLKDPTMATAARAIERICATRDDAEDALRILRCLLNMIDAEN